MHNHIAHKSKDNYKRKCAEAKYTFLDLVLQIPPVKAVIFSNCLYGLTALYVSFALYVHVDFTEKENQYYLIGSILFEDHTI